MRGKKRGQIRMKQWATPSRVKTMVVKRLERKSKNADDKKMWAEFCNDSTLHGLRYIFGTKPPSIVIRLLWGGLFVIMTMLCIGFCTKIVQRYYTDNVIFSRKFQKVEKLELPAITICNQNMFLKSKVGRSWHHMRTLAMFKSLSNKSEDIDRLAKEEWKYCNSSSEEFPPDFNHTGDYWRKNGYVQGMRNLTTDFYSNVITVDERSTYLQHSHLKYSDAFVNHVVDDGICFTFNPGRKLMASVAGSNGQLDQRFGYGIDIANFTSSKNIEVTSGFLSGLVLGLYPNRKEFCGVGQKWQGAGFKAIVHHPEEQPWFLMQKSISLAPLHSIFVGITQTEVSRKTSNLGRCVDDVHLHLFPKASRYFKGQCYQQCFAEDVFRKCQCFPQFIYRNQDCEKPVKIDGTVVDIRNYCWNDTMICMNLVKKNFSNSNLKERCPICKEPCYETQYITEVSNLLYLSENKARYFDTCECDQEEVHRKEAVEIRLYFPQMLVINVSEWPAFTTFDVFAYFGGIMGLFLGASIMSIGELLQQSIISCRRRGKANKQNSKTTKPLPRNDCNVIETVV